MPRKILLRLGLSFLFVALAIYIFAAHWLNSRIFVPLDYPVSLETRQLKSPPFQINLRETYYVSLDLDYSVDDWDGHKRCNYKILFYPQWRLYKRGSDSAQPRKLCVSSEQLRDSQGGFCNAAIASPGRYQLEWDNPAVAPCLNPRHPRLSVSTDSSGYTDAVALIQLFCIFLVGTGVALIVSPGTDGARRRSEPRPVTAYVPGHDAAPFYASCKTSASPADSRFTALGFIPRAHLSDFSCPFCGWGTDGAQGLGCVS
jgi:hypothetical protein